MKIFFLILPFLVASCKGDINPVGTYGMAAHGGNYTLSITSTGKYVLKIFSFGLKSEEITGQWKRDNPANRSISFDGVIWHGIRPEAGRGFWIATLDGRSGEKICVDGEEIYCFSKIATSKG